MSLKRLTNFCSYQETQPYFPLFFIIYLFFFCVHVFQRLEELGVESLVLPAALSVLNTWTTSFGFSEMTNSEILKFRNHTFLNFQGTVMCQKLLMKIPSSEPRVPRGKLGSP